MGGADAGEDTQSKQTKIALETAQEIRDFVRNGKKLPDRFICRALVESIGIDGMVGIAVVVSVLTSRE